MPWDLGGYRFFSKVKAASGITSCDSLLATSAVDTFCISLDPMLKNAGFLLETPLFLDLVSKRRTLLDFLPTNFCWLRRTCLMAPWSTVLLLAVCLALWLCWERLCLEDLTPCAVLGAKSRFFFESRLVYPLSKFPLVPLKNKLAVFDAVFCLTLF